MKTSTLLALGAAAAVGAYFFLRPKAAEAAPARGLTPQMSTRPLTLALASRTPAAAPSSPLINAPASSGSQPAGALGSGMSGRTIAKAAGGVAAASAAAAIPGVGPALAPLAATAGTYVGSAAYSGGKAAIDYFKGLF